MPEFATGGPIECGAGERDGIIPTSLSGCSFQTAASRLSPNAQAFMLAVVNEGTFPNPAEEAL